MDLKRALQTKETTRLLDQRPKDKSWNVVETLRQHVESHQSHGFAKILNQHPDVNSWNVEETFGQRACSSKLRGSTRTQSASVREKMKPNNLHTVEEEAKLLTPPVSIDAPPESLDIDQEKHQNTAETPLTGSSPTPTQSRRKQSHRLDHPRICLQSAPRCTTCEVCVAKEVMRHSDCHGHELANIVVIEIGHSARCRGSSVNLCSLAATTQLFEKCLHPSRSEFKRRLKTTSAKFAP